MPEKIILLGTDAKHFHFVSEALRGSRYQLEFVNFWEIEAAAGAFTGARGIILNTLPFSESKFGQFYVLRSDPRFAGIPVLALVRERPPRLRYRLVQQGIDDYLIIPFDKLDLRIRLRNLLNCHPIPPLPRAADPSDPLSVDVWQGAGRILRELNAALSAADEDQLIARVLKKLVQLCGARVAIMLKVINAREVSLVHLHPNQTQLPELTFDFTEVPVLEKAIRLNEPTVLNDIAEVNPLLSRLNPLVDVTFRSFIVQPVKTHHQQYVLAVLRTDSEPLTTLHFLLVQQFGQLLTHLINIMVLRRTVKDKMDGQVWQYYYDFLDQVVNQLRFGILVIGQDRRIKYLNNNAASLLNVTAETALYHPLGEILSEQTVNEILYSANQRETGAERPEIELRNLEGKKMAIGFSVQEYKDMQSQENGYIISLKDITESKKIREEMRRVERLASLGVMASGIAHEIRNPLAGIKAMVQTFQEELSREDPRNEYLERIVRQVNRLDELLRTLFSYARPPKPNRRFCPVDTLLSDVYSLTRQKLLENCIRFTENIPPDLPEVFVDPSQIHQVLMNLILNSIEAIEENGEVSISVRPFHLAENPAAAQRFPFSARERKTQHFLEILIADNGCGIPPEVLNKIFNPFFTTKTLGTGLGLSIVYQIVKENDGYIFYDSEVAKGTRCYLYLPTQISEPAP